MRVGRGVIGWHDQDAVGTRCLGFARKVRANAGVETHRGDHWQPPTNRLDAGRADLRALFWAQPKNLASPARRDDRADLMVR